MGHSIFLKHASPARNVPSILANGLLIAKARGRRKAVWLHSPSRTSWATAHVAGRHEVPEADVVILTVHVPRRWLRRHRAGCWCSPFDILPSQIVSVRLPFAVAG
jgi:hypothetical protein